MPPRRASVPAGPARPAVAGHGSWLDAQHGWVSRETGVCATDDGGGHWRRIFEPPGYDGRPHVGAERE